MTHSVDAHVGQRIRHRRWMMGMPQDQLAELVGLTFQQIQKYESGANRVSSSRLWDIANALEVPVEYFFDGFDDLTGGSAGDWRDIQLCREAIELVRTYYGIPEAQRRRLFDLARVLGAGCLDQRKGAV